MTTSGNTAILDQKELVDNLKLQIQSLLTEKDYIAKLWQNTLKTVEVLEGELGVFQAGAQNFLPRKDVSKVSIHIFIFFIKHRCESFVIRIFSSFGTFYYHRMRIE